MRNEALHHIPQSDNSDVVVGNSLFQDDFWDLSPLIPQKSLSPIQKKIRFNNINSEQLKHTVKQYVYYKLGQVKARTAIQTRYSLVHFIRFCEINNISSFAGITRQTLLVFAIWLKSECGLGTEASYKASFVVEELIRVGQIKGWLVPAENILVGASASEMWGAGKFEKNKAQPIPENVFDEIIRCAVNYKPNRMNDILTKCGIIIQSQTGLRINEVLSLRSGCLVSVKLKIQQRSTKSTAPEWG
jgi:hypothetical protein